MKLKPVLASFSVAVLCTMTSNAQLPQRDASYVNDLIALADTLGKAHSLRVLCNGRGDQYWRDFMRELLDLEAPDSGHLRTRMVSTFNAAYAQEQNRIRSCSQSAADAEAIYADKGRKLAEAIAERYIPQSGTNTQSEPN